MSIRTILVDDEPLATQGLQLRIVGGQGARCRTCIRSVTELRGQDVLAHCLVPACWMAASTCAARRS